MSYFLKHKNRQINIYFWLIIDLKRRTHFNFGSMTCMPFVQFFQKEANNVYDFFLIAEAHQDLDIIKPLFFLWKETK